MIKIEEGVIVMVPKIKCNIWKQNFDVTAPVEPLLKADAFYHMLLFQLLIWHRQGNKETICEAVTTKHVMAIR